ncbi:class I adenylate-forming enzyme family protein [Achromobacter sp. F4_2707]|uniref:class I adenylate-forming enzyme family protein n=1 Tax=Achromobacter sp. F4_2707 TaxID=3114286 RepID=UPI0039C6E249
MQFIHEVLQKQAEKQPDAISLYPENHAPISYGELWQHVGVAAAWLRSQGVQAGHRVMLACENCPEHIALMFACSVVGAWPVSVNARLSAGEIRSIAEHCEPHLIVFTKQCSPAAARHAEEYSAQPCKAQGLRDACSYAVYRPNAQPESPELAQQVAMLVYTSGTTGAPKGVMVTHKGLLHFARVSAASRQLSGRDIAYAALPMSHIFGIATVLMATLQAGASLVVRSRFDVDDLLAALVAPGISILQGVPTMYVRLLDVVSDAQQVQAPALRYVYTGGAALDPALKERIETLFGQPMHHGYGITEYAGSMFITRADAPRSDTSAGYAVEGVELRIVKEGRPITTAGEDGDILIRGPGVMLGYYRNPEQTAQALLPGGWLSTGDIGHIDADGALFLTGRSKDLIIRSGFNVYPLEVEAAINAFPGIRLSAVVGKKESDGNEEIIAFYETERPEDINVDALREHLAQHLAPYKRPSRFIHIDSIPTTTSGKIRKDPLRAFEF